MFLHDHGGLIHVVTLMMPGPQKLVEKSLNRFWFSGLEKAASLVAGFIFFKCPCDCFEIVLRFETFWYSPVYCFCAAAVFWAK